MFPRSFILIAVLVGPCFSGREETSAPPKDQSTQEAEASTEKTAPKTRKPNSLEDVSKGKVVVGLAKLPAIKLPAAAALTPKQAAEIKNLIAGLAKIDKPDFGLSATMSGDAFLPIEGMSHAGALLFTNHNLQTSPELKKLVELGPRALPFLLAALDDQTPTRLTIEHGGVFGLMWFDNELWGNPNNPLEMKVLPARDRRPRRRREDYVTKYVVKVGDVCLVAIGQIVGRSCAAVRYQPSGCIVLNSPTHDGELRHQVRAIWVSPDARQKLFDSLTLDYATEGVFNGESLDAWGLGAELQTNAAMRLLFYFPLETAPMIAERIDRLQAKKTGPGSGSLHTDAEMRDWMQQTLANGVRADEFVKAVAWCHEPAIKQALFRLFQRATEIDVVLHASLSVALDHRDLAQQRLTRMLDELPEETGGPFGDGYRLLVESGKYGDASVIETFRKYLKPRTLLRCRALCHALRETRPEWAVDLLGPLLSDRRDTGWDYGVNLGQNEPRLSIRVCDEAAETIAMANPTLKFDLHGKHEQLDRQIDAIRRQIETRKK
jgi:hypothetical protein